MPWSCSRRCDCGEVGILPVPLSTRLQIAPRLAALRLHHTSSVLALHKKFRLHYTSSVCTTQVPFTFHLHYKSSVFALHKFRLDNTSSVWITQVPCALHITQVPFLHYTSSVWKSSVLHYTSSACITQVPFALYKFLLHFALHKFRSHYTVYNAQVLFALHKFRLNYNINITPFALHKFRLHYITLQVGTVLFSCCLSLCFKTLADLCCILKVI